MGQCSLSEKARLASGDDALDLLDEAIDKYRRALDINSDLHQALNNWGNALSEKARLASGDDAPGLLDDAINKYRRALDVNPDLHEALNNWGVALRNKANCIDDADETERLRTQAAKKIEEARRIREKG